MILLSFLSCASPEVQTLDVECDASYITYEQVAQPFLRNYCTGCHSGYLEGEQRYGAPSSVNLDTYQDAKKWAVRSFVRNYVQEDMPPAGGVSETDKELFMRWVLCGQEGQELDQQIAQEIEDIQSYTIVVLIDEQDDGSLLLSRSEEGGMGEEHRLGLYTEERYSFQDDGVWLLSYAKYDANRQVEYSVEWLPGIPVFPNDLNLREITVQAEIWDQGSSFTEEQDWEGEIDLITYLDADAHDREPNPLQSVWSNQYGEEWGWRASIDVVLSSAWLYSPTGTSWETQQFTGADFPNNTDYFQIRNGMGWIEMLIEYGENGE